MQKEQTVRTATEAETTAAIISGHSRDLSCYEHIPLHVPSSFAFVAVLFSSMCSSQSQHGCSPLLVNSWSRAWGFKRPLIAAMSLCYCWNLSPLHPKPYSSHLASKRGSLFRSQKLYSMAPLSKSTIKGDPNLENYPCAGKANMPHQAQRRVHAKQDGRGRLLNPCGLYWTQTQTLQYPSLFKELPSK